MSDRDTPVYKDDQRELMKRAVELAAELHRLLKADWMPYGWQEAAEDLRVRLDQELLRDE